MTIECTQAGAIVCTGADVAVFQLLAVRSALKLEELGMRHSSGKAIRPTWAPILGLKPRDSHNTFIRKIEEILAENGRPVAHPTAPQH